MSRVFSASTNIYPNNAVHLIHPSFVIIVAASSSGGSGGVGGGRGGNAEIDEITDALMEAFHATGGGGGPQPTSDSYIRRYKRNHLTMCFDAVGAQHRGLFVACAVPSAASPSQSPSSSPSSSSSSSSSFEGRERIVGFCSVDGRPPDPSRSADSINSPTPATLRGASPPRPYLSDLGVSPRHRRRGVGGALVRACERWTIDRGYGTVYLRVEGGNGAAFAFYKSLGYARTRLPRTTGGAGGAGGVAVVGESDGDDGDRRRHVGVGGGGGGRRRDDAAPLLLLEKSLRTSTSRVAAEGGGAASSKGMRVVGAKRAWVRDRLRWPIKGTGGRERRERVE